MTCNIFLRYMEAVCNNFLKWRYNQPKSLPYPTENPFA